MSDFLATRLTRTASLRGGAADVAIQSAFSWLWRYGGRDEARTLSISVVAISSTKLLGTGQPHGTPRFLGAFDKVSWRSMSYENWKGFTVGIEGTAKEVFATPEPARVALLGLALVGLVSSRRKRN